MQSFRKSILAVGLEINGLVVTLGVVALVNVTAGCKKREAPVQQDPAVVDTSSLASASAPISSASATPSVDTSATIRKNLAEAKAWACPEDDRRYTCAKPIAVGPGFIVTYSCKHQPDCKGVALVGSNLVKVPGGRLIRDMKDNPLWHFWQDERQAVSIHKLDCKSTDEECAARGRLSFYGSECTFPSHLRAKCRHAGEDYELVGDEWKPASPSPTMPGMAGDRNGDGVVDFAYLPFERWCPNCRGYPGINVEGFEQWDPQRGSFASDMKTMAPVYRAHLVASRNKGERERKRLEGLDKDKDWAELSCPLTLGNAAAAVLYDRLLLGDDPDAAVEEANTLMQDYSVDCPANTAPGGGYTWEDCRDAIVKAVLDASDAGASEATATSSDAGSTASDAGMTVTDGGSDTGDAMTTTSDAGISASDGGKDGG